MDDMRMGRLRTMLIAWLMLAALAAVVHAGPVEEASEAFGRADYATALRLLRPLADQGDAAAQFNLGLMYANGHGVAQDNAEALKWFRRAADQGDVASQVSLGVIYDKGQGVEENDAEALKWYRRAADQGDATSQFILGVMYSRGRGLYAKGQGSVAQDYTEALNWYGRAADQGDADAQFNLGVMYAKGQGAAQDYTEAHKWLNLAASGFATSNAEKREQAVRERDRLAKKMTPAQVAEAQKLARDWKPK